ncbi:hypothetical protein [Achromobacter sp. 413638]|uniref:hypothetical protein n=1 Tax=Achromobacter sp. 413638 TaxID=3342385 RepID=UPI00370A5623
MRTIEIYSKDEQGLISFHGEQGWDTREEAVDYYCQSGERTFVEQVMGWPHGAITWVGNIGFGEA